MREDVAFFTKIFIFNSRKLLEVTFVVHVVVNFDKLAIMFWKISGLLSFYRFQYGKSVNNRLELDLLFLFFFLLLRPLIRKIAFLSFSHLMGIKWDKME